VTAPVVAKAHLSFAPLSCKRHNRMGSCAFKGGKSLCHQEGGEHEIAVQAIVDCCPPPLLLFCATALHHLNQISQSKASSLFVSRSLRRAAMTLPT